MAALAALQLIMVSRYGPHRDELYFVASGQHLAWGYPDQPSFTPLLARLATELAPYNLLVLRLPSLIAMALLVICAAAFARLLGGGRAAQVLTASTVAASVITVTLGHRLSTATFDTLAWTAVLLVVGHALRDDRPRLWLIAGFAGRVGPEQQDRSGCPALRNPHRRTAGAELPRPAAYGRIRGSVG